MQSTIYRANERGHANHGWLDTYHSFSFGHWYDPKRIHFGALRVLNDDTVSGGMGFGTHPHDNMEIISIPLEGELEHQDSMGNKQIIKKGDVQVMSAGTGIRHAEKNKNTDRQVKFFQIWVIPEKENVNPRYDQKHFDEAAKHNQLVTVVAPIGADEEAVQIHQQAWFSLGKFDAGKSISYTVKKPGNGIYLFVIEGSVKTGETILERRDAIALTDTNSLEVEVVEAGEVLIMEVPMMG